MSLTPPSYRGAHALQDTTLIPYGRHTATRRARPAGTHALSQLKRIRWRLALKSMPPLLRALINADSFAHRPLRVHVLS